MIPVLATLFVSSIVAYKIALRLFPKIHLVDFPERYGLKRPRLPYPGGIVAIVVFLTWFLFSQKMTMQNLGIVIAIILLGITCILDDRIQIRASIRLVLHVIVCALIVATGSRVYTITHPLGGIISLDTIDLVIPFVGPLPLIGSIVTVAWLLFAINAMNWCDGIGGQVSSLSFVGFIILGLLALLRNGQPDIALFSFVLAAIAGTSAIFDLPPHRMVLGDTGSMFFGLMLGLLGVYQGGKLATVFLVLGLPLIDAISVLIVRIVQGKSPFQGGRDHLHHRLLDNGWSEWHIISFMLMFGLTFGTTALFLTTATKVIAALLFIALYIILVFRLRKKSSVPQPSEHYQQ